MATMTASDGVTLWYEDGGSGSPILLIPGLCMSGWHWQRQQGLRDSHRVITFDPRGHGRSGKEERGWTLKQTAADVHQLITELDLRDVALVGWSMGSFVLYEYLAAFGKDRLAALCSVDMTPRNNVAADWTHAVFGDLDMGKVVAVAGDALDDRVAWQRALSSACFAAGSAVDESVIDDWTTESLRTSTGALLAFWIDLARSDWRAFTSQIDVPTLLVHGARSVAVPPASGEWLRDSIPGSRLLVFEDSGHAPFWEESDRFNRELRDFLAGLPQ